MNTRYTHQDDPVHSVGHRALGRRQARWRQLLGILLIVAGTVWLYLRVTGQIGNVPMPIDWMEEIVDMMGRITIGDSTGSVPLVAYSYSLHISSAVHGRAMASNNVASQKLDELASVGTHAPAFDSPCTEHQVQS